MTLRWARSSTVAFAPFLGIAVVAVVAACGEDEPPAAPADAGADAAGCNVEKQTGCDAEGGDGGITTGLVCEVVEGGKTGCFAPVFVEGRVVSTAAPNAGIKGARVVARDVSGALVSRDVAISADDGSYRLAIPSPRKADGTPTVPSFALRADAAGFATFPGGLRVSLPIDTSTLVTGDAGRSVIENAGTDVGLDPLPSADGLGSIKGVVRHEKAAGTLVVAGSQSGIAAPDGSYEVFNVPAGAANVSGYQQGVQLKPVATTVPSAGAVEGVDLIADAAALATVKGSVSFVNAGSQSTSVVLVVKSTFNANLARGEVPRGLRAANVSGAYEFTEVPAGEYVVLAAFENDGLVRDPDTSIGGTALQTITVGSTPVDVTSFKITGALDVVRPGAATPEAVTGTPTFEWKDDSSEDGYELFVFDTFGVKTWEKLDVPRVTGSGNVSVVYGGPALVPGAYYQFRAVSWRGKQGDARTYISATEDLKGVFIAK